jgi:DNA repair protein RecO (recombination protein O)
LRYLRRENHVPETFLGVEWEAAGIILHVAPFGEADAVAAVFTEEFGLYRGLARGGASRARANIWQTGNLVEARWVARLADQLGSITAELVHPSAALAMQNQRSLAILSSACAVAEGALPEREPHQNVFRGLLHLIVHSAEIGALAELIQWEAGLLAQLGYGLDLVACAVTGARGNLAYVSPKSGRAVSDEGAGLWRERLLPLPPFMTGDARPPTPEHLSQALRITGHFLARDLFGARHRPLPAARTMLYEAIRAEAESARPAIG